MDSHHSIQTPSLRPSLPLCQTICLMPTLYNSTNPAPYRIEFGDPTIWAYHHENKTCTCNHLDWILVHDIPFPLHYGDHFTPPPGLALFSNFFELPIESHSSPQLKEVFGLPNFLSLEVNISPQLLFRIMFQWINLKYAPF